MFFYQFCENEKQQSITAFQKKDSLKCGSIFDSEQKQKDREDKLFTRLICAIHISK